MIEKIFQIISPKYRFLVLILNDLTASLLSLVLAALLLNSLRFSTILAASFLAITMLKIGLLYASRIYSISWRYASLKDIFVTFRILTIASLSLFIGSFFVDFITPNFIIIDFLIFNLIIFTSRFCIRFLRKKQQHSQPVEQTKNVVILGAGDAGEMVAREIIKSSPTTTIIAFFDDNLKLQNKTIHQIPVVGPINQLEIFARNHMIDQIIIAIPSATSDQFRQINSICKGLNVHYKTTPGINELIDGNVQVEQLREVSIIDLLGRSQINIDTTKIQANVSNKTILITGAGGSIGSEISRQLTQFKPTKIILVDHSEFHLYTILNELNALQFDSTIIPVCLDIKSRPSLERLFNDYLPDTIFHSAAYKHVPLMEINADQAILNNIGGTKNIIDLADQYNVKQCVVISTDKAVEPSNSMGATKRICELLVFNKAKKSKTMFSCVRFGNVLGSYGSVIPLFKDQIKKGGPITITDENMTRYFMTIKEAVSLVFESATMVKTNGELFVLDMGKPIRIIDLAHDLIRLSGLSIEDIPIQVTGLRPGEKLSEKLFYPFETPSATNHKKINSFNYTFESDLLLPIESILEEVLNGRSNDDLILFLQEKVKELNDITKLHKAPIS
ncbi:MAG: nucleoside-diphosphate sugar epimerase/dehydratase [Candidatus Margulisiibacteriota bacterium]|nr:nucleoside-diphosphate sugar epimerase/dehydratase [Candidatus Margulisiibacteriota bacterium]